jgi:hypothetical protein
MDSPDQSAFDIPMTAATFQNNQLELTLTVAKIVYKAILQNDTLKGEFTQAGQSMPLEMTRNILDKTVVKKQISKFLFNKKNWRARCKWPPLGIC